MTYVDQGAAAVAAVEESLRAGAPFQLIFLDMRMPPGIDGKETARLIRLLDPEIHLVMVTGYSDRSPIEVAKVAGPFDKLYYVAKPFEIEEILQLARALSEKWRIERELKHARDAANAASVAKSQFLSMMSHEIRTPLNGILGMAQVIAASTREEHTRNQASTLLASGDAMLVILNDILDMSKISAGKLEITPGGTKPGL